MRQESRRIRLFLVIIATPLALILAWLGLMTATDNILGWFLILVGAGYLIGGAVSLWAGKRGSPRASGEEEDDRSFWLILPGFLAVFYASPFEYLYLPAWLPRGFALQVAGLAFIALGLLLRIWTRQALRKLYTGHVQILTEHRLVTQGPYRWIRHPGYAGFVLMATGLVVGFSSLLGIIAIPTLMLPGLAYRIKVEERLLEDRFGGQYREYARSTKRLIPGVW